MGRIRTAEIKRVSHKLVAVHADKFSIDFRANKEALHVMKLTDEKRVNNRIAGYVTRLMKRRG